MKLRRMLALTLVLMTLMTAALATDAQMPFEIRVEWRK